MLYSRMNDAHAAFEPERNLRQFTVGKEPITPLRQAATTRSVPETRNIGAAISGRLRRSRKRERASGDCVMLA